MDILIVGNGFDLSHFLPTKYDHFMEAMKSIEGFQGSSGMEFDDIYKILYVKEAYFFNKTKELYKYDLIKLDKDQVQTFKVMLQQNIWYKYFLNHVNDIQTWIDFEQKIEEALIHSVKAINIVNEKHSTTRFFNSPIFTTPRDNPNSYFFTEFQFNILTCLTFIIPNPQNASASVRVGSLNSNYFKSPVSEIYGLDSTKFISFLQKELDKFIEIFNLYLELIINNLVPIQMFKKDKLKEIHKVYSFNYTNTFEKFYNNEININYLHGKFGSNQNLVLGISDLNDASLKRLKAYGFTKYHQKLLNETDYTFLHEIITKYNDDLKDHENALINFRSSITDYALRSHATQTLDQVKNRLTNINLNFYIWGHSLDVSDESYIKEIFSFNEHMDNNVHVTVYHFNKVAKFDLLANLIYILGKEKVEYWMKNKWLTFKPNPEII